MSLKAKLEAVIYAAEEPVTLAQFALLFAEEAFLWKAERDAKASPVLQFTESGEPALLPETSAEVTEVDAARELTASEDSLTWPDGQADTPEASSVPASGNSASEAAALEAAELEARRQARVRERQAREILREILDELIADYAADSRGIEIREIAGGFRMGTKPEIHDAVRAFVKSLKPPMKLSLPALETLAVIAYKQPVTAPEVGEIRGVDSAGVLGSLMSRKLIATAGRKQVVGRPMLYKTTKEFLLRFGLKDLNELPSMEEFEKMAALELNEESLDEESDETEGPIAESGDLFAEAVAPEAQTLEPQTEEPESALPASHEQAMEPSTPTAEPSHHEAAEAHAIVERQNAEEVEAEV
jgi:segregation and condensation protein B